MGLDMYLSKKTYVRNWETSIEKYSVTVTKGGKNVTHIKPERIKYIVEEVCYWRKANAIHNWFVVNCQDGVDNCAEYYVTESDLTSLLDTIEEILSLPEGQERNDLALKKLPPISGFFFGGTEIDKYYYEDLIYTREELIRLFREINEDMTIEFCYQSSW